MLDLLVLLVLLAPLALAGLLALQVRRASKDLRAIQAQADRLVQQAQSVRADLKAIRERLGQLDR